MKKFQQMSKKEKVLVVVAVVLMVVAISALARAEEPTTTKCLAIIGDRAYEVTGTNFIDIGNKVAEKEKNVTKAKFICQIQDGKIHLIDYEQKILQ